MKTYIQVLALILVFGIAGAIIFTPLGDPIKDLFADSVSGEEAVQIITEYETIWVNNTEYVEVPVWYNQTIWVNETEYIEVPVWYNQTEYVNTTYWVNITSYYPFESGWNVSSSTIYMKVYRMSNTYRMDYYDQNTMVLGSTQYKTYSNFLTDLNSAKSSGAINQLQYDNALVQIFILNPS